MNTKHGDSNTRLYNVWAGIIYRCENKKCKSYKHYGGRGISVCDEWRKKYSTFKDWAMANGYKENLTIDRIDVNGNYEPLNCRWVTMKKQANNKRTNLFITYNGITKTASEWDKEMNYERGTIQRRIRAGWSIDRTIEEKPFIGKNQSYKK